MLRQIAAWWRRLFPQRRLPFMTEFRHFFGPDFDQLPTHDKYYPGYDIVSLNRALVSFHEEAADNARSVGACGVTTLRQLFDTFKYNRNQLPGSITYGRIPIDVEEEASFVMNGLWFSVMRPEAGRGLVKKSAAVAHAGGAAAPESAPEKIAVLLASLVYDAAAWDGMETHHVPRQQATLSIACRSREVADRFFAEIEERRKRLSVFRGKVIDPVVGPGGIQTVGFRPIHKVRENDLILPERVKSLLSGSVLGFYRHRDVLRGLDIELKRGILLHGPPGTGKTSISLYLAGCLPNFTICFISGERLLYPREVCRMARYLQPAMIVFEDIDLVAHERNANGLATVLGELMNQIDGCEPSDQVLFVMTTNSLDRLEHAVKNRPGRVDQIIEIPLPSRTERRQLLTYFLRNLRLKEDNPDRLLDATDGATPAMLKEIVKRGAVNAIERNHEKGNGELFLEESDLLLATEQVRALRDAEALPGSLGFRESAGR
jgi:hypothetical protein